MFSFLPDIKSKLQRVWDIAGKNSGKRCIPVLLSVSGNSSINTSEGNNTFVKLLSPCLSILTYI